MIWKCGGWVVSIGVGVVDCVLMHRRVGEGRMSGYQGRGGCHGVGDGSERSVIANCEVGRYCVVVDG